MEARSKWIKSGDETGWIIMTNNLCVSLYKRTHDPDRWYFFCRPIIIEHLLLKSRDLEAAKAEALQIVRGRLELLSDDLDSILGSRSPSDQQQPEPAIYGNAPSQPPEGPGEPTISMGDFEPYEHPVTGEILYRPHDPGREQPDRRAECFLHPYRCGGERGKDGTCAGCNDFSPYKPSGSTGSVP